MLTYDVVTAAIAKSVSVSYDSFLVPAWVLFFFMGVVAGRTLRSWNGILAVGIAAVVAATAGWYLAALIGPGYVPGWTLQTLALMAAESMLLSTALGGVGVWIGLAVPGARRGLF